MMPSLDRCISKSSDMTTLTNTLEVFDTYKHREDKDSDEESFHLPLDDDESDSKVPDPVKNGTGNESEEEILNKFGKSPTTFDNIDSQLEERLLNEDEEEKKGIKEESKANAGDSLQTSSGEVVENGHCTENDKESCTNDQNEANSITTNQIESKNAEGSEDLVGKEGAGLDKGEDSAAKEVDESEAVTETEEVPKVDVDLEESLPSAVKEPSAIEPEPEAVKPVDKPEESPTEEEKSKDQEVPLSSEKIESDDNASQSHEDASDDAKLLDKCDSNDSTKQNEDSEDLFDISIIRDAEEDNAESAYNEAHSEENQEENEEYDEKMEEDCVNEKTANEEDDVDIEEANLKLDEGEGEGNKTDLVQIDDKEQKTSDANSGEKSAGECRLDEVTGNLIGGDGRQVDVEESSVENKEVEGSSTRTSLKRPLEEGEIGAAKKSRTEHLNDVEIKEVEKPKEKLPLKTLLSLSDFMKSKKHNKRLTMHDLEEFCVQKICEVIVHKSELGDVHHQLKLQEQLIETMRKEIQQLTKQARDLEIVNKKLMNDLKQQNSTQKPLNPLKITRSVGLQVKFTPSFEANLKRRQPNAVVNQKAQSPIAPNRSRVVPNAVATSVNKQVASPQKQQQQQLPKFNTPLLSQALQSRRNVTPEANKIQNQTIRQKPVDPKAPSASVIDLTDEDDKKDKNKNTPPKMVPPKNLTFPIRTTPMRVNATAQGIRLATSQGKVSPISSLVNSTTSQVMYVVQSSPQNVLASTLGSKAVVVNFQSTNGVITSTLNGSAVSVIPKQQNTIQLKTMAPTKPLQNNKIVKVNKHPAPLPAPPVVRVNSEKALKPIPPKPHLTIRKTDTGIILQWKMPYELEMYEVIASYQLYAYQETSALPSTDMWRKVGDVKALALPMACTLTQFADKNKYYFAVRPVDIHKRIGMFSEPEEISL